MRALFVTVTLGRAAVGAGRGARFPRILVWEPGGGVPTAASLDRGWPVRVVNGNTGATGIAGERLRTASGGEGVDLHAEVRVKRRGGCTTTDMARIRIPLPGPQPAHNPGRLVGRIELSREPTDGNINIAGK